MGKYVTENNNTYTPHQIYIEYVGTHPITFSLTPLTNTINSFFL